MNNCVAIIPARGGSKRIPDKNIKPFHGKPIIAHSIDTARASGLFDAILVSTDSEKIAEVARQHGAETPFLRDAQHSNDKAGLDGVIVDALERLQAGGRRFKYACCLLATAPMVRAEDVREGLARLKEAGSRMCLPVTTFPYCIYRALQRDEKGRTVMVWPENLRKHSQEFPEAFHDAGVFYWFDVDLFLKNPGQFFADAVPLFLPRDRVQDIDTPEDWEVAEGIYARLHPAAV